MFVPETPASVQQLDLMLQLNSYAEGKATWFSDSSPLGHGLQQACRSLHTQIVEAVTHVFAFLLDRINAREMDMFTMHDRHHGMKVAHLMWHIISPARRQKLSPSEIGLLVLSAFLHDAGMALTREEREKRLAADSELWLHLEGSDEIKKAFLELREKVTRQDSEEGARLRAEAELQQAEEALLTADTRARHATKQRYVELLSLLSSFHEKDQTRIPDIERSMSFDGNSFRAKLIDVCVSHNESADVLVERDPEDPHAKRFARLFPVGRANADLQFVAAALRLADILDFDRERTPPMLFNYLLPGAMKVGEHISVLEWSKHLAISNWEITDTEIVFRGQCSSHIVHHAIVQFCAEIEREIAATRASFTTLGSETSWPFTLPKTVTPDIHQEGYRYVPYRFELDDSRIYSLLMGGAIYDNPLVAVRELIQNSVDACKLRDALTALHEPETRMSTEGRIKVLYDEPTNACSIPVLTIEDSGTGMDGWIIERWFLQVGRSYYSSPDFNKTRYQLRGQSLDFAPVSEFGIGFLSCFLLADRVEVETAMWEDVRGDTRRRRLIIDGPSRLIRLQEDANLGAGRLKGTRIRLYLCRGGDEQPIGPPCWDEILQYVADSCQELPYTIHLQQRRERSVLAQETIAPQTVLEIPPEYEKVAIRIPVDSASIGLTGEIAIIPPEAAHAMLQARFQESPISLSDYRGEMEQESVLVRGGFNIGSVPGLPSGCSCYARVRRTWQSNQNRRYGNVNLARNSATDIEQVWREITKTWLLYLVKHRSELSDGLVRVVNTDYSTPGISYQLHRAKGPLAFLESFSAYDIYEFVRHGWNAQLSSDTFQDIEAWEAGDGPPLPDFGGGGVARRLFNYVLNDVLEKFTLNEIGRIGLFPPPPSLEGESQIKARFHHQQP